MAPAISDLTAQAPSGDKVRMSELRTRIESRLRALVDDLETLVREEARAVISSALGATGIPELAARSSRANGARADEPTPGVPARRSRKVRGRRGEAQMKRDMDGLVAYVRSHPGAKMEEAAASMRSSSHRLNRPMHKLVAERVLRREGERRASRYWIRGA